MRTTALGLLTTDHRLWNSHVKEALAFCDEFLVYQYGDCEEAAMAARAAGAVIVDTPLDYLQTSDTGTGLTTLYHEAYKRGSEVVFMADPTEKWVGDPEIAKSMTCEVEVVYSKMFRARATNKDYMEPLFKKPYFEPEYNYKAMFCRCRPGRLFWAMYPFWPYGALSKAEYGITKSYALARSGETYKILTLGASNASEMTPELEEESKHWIVHDGKSREGNDLITVEEFATKGVKQ